MISTTDNRGRPYAGICCPECGAARSYIVDSRNRKDGGARRRRHQCKECQSHYTTYEVHAEEYETMQVVRANLARVDAAVTALQVIRGELGNSNGHGGVMSKVQDREALK